MPFIECSSPPITMGNPRIDAASQGKLLPTIIDELARDEPNGLWIEYPTSPTDLNAGYSQITYAELANAVNGVANCITSALGRDNTGESLAWLAPNSPLCSITLIAAMKAGFKLCLMSERNTVAQNHKLLEDVECSIIITTNAVFPQVRATLRGKQISVIELPLFEQLLHEHQRRYEYNKELKLLYYETALIIHNPCCTGKLSKSNNEAKGSPKPMLLSHSFIANVARSIGLSAPEGYETQSSMLGNKRCLLLCPLSDPAGVHFGVLNAIFNKTTVILPLPEVPPTGRSLAQTLRHIDADWAVLAPSTLETMSHDASSLEEVASRLECLVFAGGCLAKRYGDLIASKIKLMPSPHSPETGQLPTIYRHEHDFRYDWNYFRFHPAVGARFVPKSAGVHELVFNRTPAVELYLPILANSYEFLTQDLYAKHPTIPDTWTHAPQVIPLIHGEKPEPIDFNRNVCSFSDISASLGQVPGG
ncbi:hypothetical protein ANOM_004785 [Aspergillus nomiae NRRL 13137]|uniref:AMP-dependent synthetase/ligase domain-containing protein n=1 Tax=Aspergillus nomiae NRRL (strain ATCC 15546 / NRRL 13137 / CBS 260.88 / M93) TaxID=1509407 RepID=A0A0L1J642_ASPN3|nr:uncharacterized protein ANOM_004785 [Aspergillus nomiae NRRL 13137]KNG87145.1 hypothetical protein ANOM_004785 [Aspergillus nomiae NRRL 13137]